MVKTLSLNVKASSFRATFFFFPAPAACTIQEINFCLYITTSSYSEYNLMDYDHGNMKVIPDHFQVSTPSGDSPQNGSSLDSQPSIDNPSRSCSSLWSWQKLRSAALMLNLFSLRGLPWSVGDGQEKVQLTAGELESLRSELADIEEREAHLKARLEHIDGILRSARLAGYLYIRTRWTALPGEPASIDGADVDDWLLRFAVLHGQCIFFYLFSTDLSPQDSTLLSDVVEVGCLPSFTREDEGTRYSFYILTRQGLRYECSHVSKIQVDTWLSALQTNYKSFWGLRRLDVTRGALCLGFASVALKPVSRCSPLLAILCGCF